MDSLRTTRLHWTPAFRIISTRFPAVNVYDRIASAQDFDALFELEALTNPRLREEAGLVSAVRPEHRKYGPGFGSVMAAFTHLNPNGSRFSDGRYGVFYAAREKETAIAETRHHQSLFLAATAQAPIDLQMCLQWVDIEGRFTDLRRLPADHAIYSADSYAASRAMAEPLRAAATADPPKAGATPASGVVYRSVRRAGGQCVGAFHPGPVSACRHAAYLLYRWDGRQITDVLEKVA